MKPINIYIMLLVTLFFTACSDDMVLDRVITSDICFSVGFSNDSNMRLVTNNVFKSTFVEGDAIGLFIYKREETQESSVADNRLYADNIKMSYDGSFWYKDSPVYYPDDGALLDIYAYYPYKEGAMVDALEYDASVDMSDLLSASVLGVKKGSGLVMLTFHRLLALVHITIDKTDRVPDFDATMSVYFRGIIGGVYNLSTNEMRDPLDGAVSMAIVGAEDPETRTYRAWIPAQRKEPGRLFTFAQTTLRREFSLVRDVTEPLSFFRGRVYRSEITLDQEVDKDPVYSVYDLYPNYGTPVGLVVNVFNEGKSGIVISLRDLGYAQWSVGNWYTGATDVYDGISNKMKIQSQPDWEERYPAFKLCVSLGERWYLPAREEAYAYLFWYRDAINWHLERIEGGEPIAANISYLTSSETGYDVVNKIYTGNGSTENYHKVAECLIRAFFEF